jgi:hypothetical protein
LGLDICQKTEREKRDKRDKSAGLLQIVLNQWLIDGDHSWPRPNVPQGLLKARTLQKLEFFRSL